MSLTELQLLALVRASLWQKPVEESLFMDGHVDWQRIGQLALQQTVGILTFEAALSLPPTLRPPKEWIQRALSFIETNRRTHILVNRCVAESVSKLRREGIKTVLLKGQAYARAYPRSEMRQCGDIDLYVGEYNYRPAYDAVKSFDWKREEKFLPEAKHYGCWLNGVRIELHRMAAQVNMRNADRKFRQWSLVQISQSDRTVPVSGHEIPVPTPIFDIVFVFLHLYHHFMNGGIGLRHICDWTMLLHSHASEIDAEELEKRLTDFRLLRAWKTFTPIAVEQLGLPESECPFYTQAYKRQSEKILAFIFKEGNFGRASKRITMRPKGYLAGKVYSFRMHTSAQLSRLSIDPNTISKSYISYVIKGITRVIKDIMKRD